MKTYCLLIIVLMLILAACKNDSNSKEYSLQVFTTNGEGINKSFATIDCDSVSMLSKNEIFIWIDGVKMKVIADKITVSTKRN